MITFLVEESAFDRADAQKFSYAALEVSEDVRFLDYIPFGGTVYDVIDGVKNPLVFYGSLNMLKDCMKKGKTVPPFAWCDWDALSCHTYYAHYGPYIVQREYGFYPLAEILRKQDWLYKTYGVDDKIFIRPNGNDKAFNGEVVAKGMLYHWHSQAMLYEPPPNTICVVSKPVKIAAEWRTVIADGKVITNSLYREGGMFQPQTTEKDDRTERVIQFAEEMAALWQPHPIFVMDIAETYDEWLKVLEIGPVNAAGFYKCDVRKIVEKMAEIAGR